MAKYNKERRGINGETEGTILFDGGQKVYLIFVLKSVIVEGRQVADIAHKTMFVVNYYSLDLEQWLLFLNIYFFI